MELLIFYINYTIPYILSEAVVNNLIFKLIFVRAQDICYKQVDKKIPLSYIIVIKKNKLN